MKFRVDEQYLEEVRTYDLRCSCEDCIHYDGDSGACSLGWPNSDHVREAVCWGRDGWILFCKDFALE